MSGTTPETIVVSEEDLLKSLRQLEGKADEPKPEPKTVVKTGEEVKTVQALVAEKGTEVLRKSLDASKPLQDFVDVLGLHVDETLQTLQKSIQKSGERDLAFIGVLTDMKKSIDTLAAKVEAFGALPAGAPASKTGEESTTTEVLTKGLKDNKPAAGGADAAKAAKSRIMVGLDHLVKSLPPGSPEAVAYVNAAVKFETTNEIDDGMLQRATGAYKKLSAG